MEVVLESTHQNTVCLPNFRSYVSEMIVFNSKKAKCIIRTECSVPPVANILNKVNNLTDISKSCKTQLWKCSDEHFKYVLVEKLQFSNINVNYLD